MARAILPIPPIILRDNGQTEAWDASRKDFWNDPNRWDGIDDPRKTMIWEVRRRDVIDFRQTIKWYPGFIIR